MTDTHSTNSPLEAVANSAAAKQVKGMLGGLGVTLRTMFKPAVTVQYPHEKEAPPTRARGVIALK